jgi:hypothetical protein
MSGCFDPRLKQVRLRSSARLQEPPREGRNENSPALQRRGFN